MSTQMPEGLTEAMAFACLMRRGLEIVAEQGRWNSLPEAARCLFAAAMIPTMGSPLRQIADIVQERDDEKALSNTLLAKLKERDATIASLRAKLNAAEARAA